MGKLAVAFSFVLFSAVAVAQQACDFFSQDAGEKLERALKQASTCSKAADLLSECRWGSNADIGFASIVIQKCEKVLLPKLTQNGKARYKRERELCAYEYAEQDGSLSHSELVMCAVFVAQNFVEKPELAEQPAPRASFDCTKAATSIEKAICSDDALGRADIVLDRAYRPVLRSMPAEKRPMLISQQGAWRIRVEKHCGVGKDPLTPAAIGCMRKEFEKRFADLDGCGVGGPEECLNEMPDNTK